MRLVDNWKTSWKWYSTHVTVANGAILAGWTQFPDDLKGHLPHNFIIWLAVVLLGAGLFGRIIDQSRSP
jgi:hypothetical protein